MTSYTDAGITVYRAIAIRRGLALWREHKIKPNSAWTPSAMMQAASAITGRTFRPRSYAEAEAALADWLEINAPLARAKGLIR